MRYILDTYKLFIDLLPWFIRKDDSDLWSYNNDNWSYNNSIWAWISTSNTASFFSSILTGGLNKVNSSLISFVNLNLYNANITGQVLYLEKILNDLFDNTYRRIYILDENLLIPPTIYSNSDQEPNLIIYASSDNIPVYIYNEIEYFTFANFIVKVPFDRMSQIEAIKGHVNKYKLTATKYMIMGYGGTPPDDLVIDNG